MVSINSPRSRKAFIIATVAIFGFTCVRYLGLSDPKVVSSYSYGDKNEDVILQLTSLLESRYLHYFYFVAFDFNLFASVCRVPVSEGGNDPEIAAWRSVNKYLRNAFQLMLFFYSNEIGDTGY